MAIASISKGQHSGAQETECMIDMPPKDLRVSNGSREHLDEADESDIPTDIESSSGISEKVTKPGTAHLILDNRLKKIYEDILLFVETLSEPISSKDCATSTENPIAPSIRRYNGNPFSEAVSNGIFCSTLSEKTGFIGKIPVLPNSEKSRDPGETPSSSSGTSVTSCRTPGKSIFSNLGMPPVSLPETNSSEMPKSLSKAIKTPVLVGRNSNKTLSDFLLMLGNWGVRGLDKSLNRPMMGFYAYFRNHLQYGLDIIEQMIRRLCMLRAAVSNLLNPYLSTSDRLMNRVHGDLFITYFMVWASVADIKISVIRVIKNLTRNPEKRITELFNNMATKLLLLSEEIEKFQDAIRVFCSEIERFL